MKPKHPQALVDGLREQGRSAGAKGLLLFGGIFGAGLERLEWRQDRREFLGTG